MFPLPQSASRRGFLFGGLALGAAAWTTPGAFAELLQTPRLTEGPFYPNKLPLDTDNDLLIVNDSITPAVGEVTHLTGTVRDLSGAPVRNALVEIWQVDAKGIYLNTNDRSGSRATQADKNFQGFGRFMTGSKGEYYFRTIKPVAYPGRTPHIHVKVKRGNKEVLTTQIMIRGHAGNDRDGVFRSAGDLIDRELVLADFTPIKDSKAGELAATFDIVLGKTPDESPARARKS